MALKQEQAIKWLLIVFGVTGYDNEDDHETVRVWASYDTKEEANKALEAYDLGAYETEAFITKGKIKLPWKRI